MLHGEAEAHTAAEGIAEHVDLLVAERFQHRRHVVAYIDEVDLAVAQLGAAVPLQIVAIT